ncbi:MAG: bifunctional precorrin-2 dehydrogenase/sirohydrochlorin ferrochelatase [Spirochaetia bacterium]|jgi:precorrin-2 dehydrogenase/sirohydrochlorin ferrochelatase|nr:bifunctional precorrin-2 dehydrogenase/sirohydrochlorin ferrochelatase [Spirochaetia bacterium]
MILYPAMINIENRRVTVIGAGEVALRKVQDLLDSGAHVKVVSPQFHADFNVLKEIFEDRLELTQRQYEKGDIADSLLVFSATDDAEANKAVFEDALRLNILINAVDDPPNCSFFVPSFTRRGDLILAVSTSGASPAFAARMRRELEEHIPNGVEDSLIGLRMLRELLKNDDDFKGIDYYQRGRLLNKITNSDSMLDTLITAVHDDSVKEFLQFIISD